MYTVESPSTFSGPSSKGPGRIVTLRAAISAESEGMESPASLQQRVSRDFYLAELEERIGKCGI